MPNSVNQPVLEVVWTQQQRSVYYLKDHLGSVRASVDDNGQLLSRDDYDPWGLQLAGRSMTVQPNLPNKFTGKEWDEDFGLNVYHIGARRYDPEIGRWWSVDALTQQVPGVSPYSYPFNNPLRFTDPTGMAGNDKNDDDDDEVDGREGISFRAQFKDAATVLNMLWNRIAIEAKQTPEYVAQGAKKTAQNVKKEIVNPTSTVDTSLKKV